jgi:AraC-like DNA-binding protein/CheY-like chemotaxis protein
MNTDVPIETTDRDRKARLRLVTGAHRFLWRVLPFRAPESQNALENFVREIEAIQLPWLELEAVLLQCLAVLNNHTGGRLPSLVDRYLSSGVGRPSRMARFVRCVEDILVYQGIGNPLIQRAIDDIRTGSGSPQLTPRAIARRLNVSLPTLYVAFLRQTGMRLSDYIREARLQNAARSLLRTNSSIKETWAAAGYNHASNFSHDFKRRFHVTATEYRQRAVGPAERDDPRLPGDCAAGTNHGVTRSGRDRGTPVLVAADDEWTCHTVEGAIAERGFAITVATTAEAAIQQAARLSPRVIVLDDELGDGNGLAVLRAIRARGTVNPPPIVLFSSDYDLFGLTDALAELGATVVSKLCDLDQLRQVIERLCTDAMPQSASAPRPTTGPRWSLA